MQFISTDKFPLVVEVQVELQLISLTQLFMDVPHIRLRSLINSQNDNNLKLLTEIRDIGCIYLPIKYVRF